MGHRVRIRVGDVRSERWSVWSPPVWFGVSRPFLSQSRPFLCNPTPRFCPSQLSPALPDELRPLYPSPAPSSLSPAPAGNTGPAIPRLPVYVIAVAVTLICALGLAFAWKR